ncbi:ABC-three component system middle component 2 [Pseudoalteromonas luteoviolacea]|uniref:ABC-three component system middle component 2 n=1 Tax=Pseudoalteromonas luteoviolacea TaxID=43657 RepID=UPI0011521993|nr:ABC-three component system middle component 2 [Pseudoalteromonas luteoviolacea]TQF70004.1 threonine transporter [Pseudoalteromonas luteoviolacea]
MSERPIFNSALEAGVRAVSFLNTFFPQSLDFEQLIKVDYILVNSSDFGGPQSLHPQTPNRIGELNSRRKTVRSGVDLMKRFGLIDLKLTDTGVYYFASEEAEPFLELMKASYSLEMKDRARWLAKEVNNYGFERLDRELDNR